MIKKFITAWTFASCLAISAPALSQGTAISGLPAATSATGADTTVIVQSGTTKKIALSAMPGGVSRQTFSNADASVTVGNRVIEQIGSMGASRVLTLAAASAYAAGDRVLIADVSGTVTATNTIVVTAAGSDAINGASTYTINGAYGAALLETDGTSKWTVVAAMTCTSPISSMNLGGIVQVTGTSGCGTMTTTAITGLVKGNGTSVASAYGGSSPSACSSQFLQRVVTDANGALTFSCAAVNLGNSVTGTLPVGNGGTGGTTAQAAAQNLAVTRTIYQQGLPMLYLSTATVAGCPGACLATIGTALSTTAFPSHAYCHVPGTANVDGTSTAGWFYCEAASTTTVRLYSNTPYTPSSTPPAIPGSKTLSTTLTGWTGETGAVTFASFTVPGGSMGANGRMYLEPYAVSINNASTHSISATYGGSFTAISTQTFSTAVILQAFFNLYNEGSTQIQTSFYGNNTALVNPIDGTSGGAVDSGSDQTFAMTMNKAAATDNMMIWPISAKATYAP